MIPAMPRADPIEKERLRSPRRPASASQPRLVSEEPWPLAIVTVVQVADGEGLIDLVQPLGQLAALLQGVDLATGDGGRVVGRLDQPTVEVERGARPDPLAELDRRAQQV